MERTPTGTPVGVDDPYAHAGRCDHLTSDGRCRYALERAGDDPGFAAERRADGYDCVAAGETDWADCPHYRSTTDGRACRRCGLSEVRLAHDDDDRPLVEEHHLSYESGGSDSGHEITVALCRWCHAKVHAGRARVDDDADPDPDALDARERRRRREREELGFRTAAERTERGERD